MQCALLGIGFELEIDRLNGLRMTELNYTKNLGGKQYIIAL